nr:DUF2235 domain-containing protein [uncultured Erwinia sp.]
MDNITCSGKNVLPENHFARVNIPPERVLSIGIFFDGSGNNADNTLKRLEMDRKADEAESHLAGAPEAPGPGDLSRSSYDKYFTNIYRLFTLYQANTDEANASQQGIYISGAGTHSGQPDGISGFAIGEGKSGIIAKTDEAIAGLPAALRQIIRRRKEKGRVSHLMFDLFGFSRGAAAARHFANRIIRRDPPLIAAIVEGLRETGDGDLPVLSIRFLGLFDGVAGIANLANGFDPHSPPDGSLQLALSPGIAHRVFQIAAGHEYRYNYSLQSVAPDYPELILPGAHSDIGGGYNPREEEYLFLTQPQFTTVPMAVPDDLTDAVSAARRQMRGLLKISALAPLLNAGALKVESWHDERLPPDQHEQARKRVGAAVVFRRRLHNDWAKIALRVMTDAAQEAGVTLSGINEDDPEFSLPPELRPLCEFAREQGKRLRGGQSLQPFSPEMLHIAGRYIHFSAHWCAVQESFVWRDGGWLTTVSKAVRPEAKISYPDRPEENWMRTIYRTGDAVS